MEAICAVFISMLQVYRGGGGGGGTRLPNKGRYGCAGPGIRYFRGQFSPGHQVLGGKFCLGITIRFLAIFDKKMCNN